MTGRRSAPSRPLVLHTTPTSAQALGGVNQRRTKNLFMMGSSNGLLIGI
jgi:hypothetical protein